MTASALVAAAAGGALGSLGRYLVGFYMGRTFGTVLPYGTLAINVSGSFLIGALTEALSLRWSAPLAIRIFLVTGICGGYTTFSSFTLETVTMVERGNSLSAFTYVVSSVVLSLLAFYGALSLMRGDLLS